jgi:hypothetical protein
MDEPVIPTPRGKAIFLELWVGKNGNRKAGGSIGRDHEPGRCDCSCAAIEARLQPYRGQFHTRY